MILAGRCTSIRRPYRLAKHPLLNQSIIQSMGYSVVCFRAQWRCSIVQGNERRSTIHRLEIKFGRNYTPTESTVMIPRGILLFNAQRSKKQAKINARASFLLPVLCTTLCVSSVRRSYNQTKVQAKSSNFSDFFLSLVQDQKYGTASTLQ